MPPIRIKAQCNGRWIECDTEIDYRETVIAFPRAVTQLREEIKAMRGAKWSGAEWTVDNCHRNRFQIDYLSGKDVYGWFDRPIVPHVHRHAVMAHQQRLADIGLTYHYALFAADPGVGKTLSAQCVIEGSGAGPWYWVGPKNALPNIEREFRNWAYRGPVVHFMSYDALIKRMRQGLDGPPPLGVVFDEIHKLKNPEALRSRAAQSLADMIRDAHGMRGFVIGMSGTAIPKTPLDVWSLAEIIWPGFLREGSRAALQQRLAFTERVDLGAGAFEQVLGWRDNPAKCNVCGLLPTEPHDGHSYVSSINEIALLSERLKGLLWPVFKKDCLDLPEKIYRRVECDPSASILRVAEAIKATAPSTIVGLTQLRELSDGFLYRDAVEGETACDHCENGKVYEWPEGVRTETTCPVCHGSLRKPRIVRIAKRVPCPKDEALAALLDECEATGRIVIFGGFTGTLDRIQDLCERFKWEVIRCDGQGLRHTTQQIDAPLDYWADRSNERVAFVANPESGGVSFTLTESSMVVFYSNSFKPEYRPQSEDRIHRIGTRGAVIVDLIHLPTDQRVLDRLKEGRRLERMALGEF